MNNSKFIEQAFFNQTRKSEHGNLLKDSKGNVYSYGMHYPLLFRAIDNDNLYFINNTGYSNTTSKHIGHAWRATDYKGIGIKLNGERLNWNGFTLNDALRILSKELADLKVLADSKKRKNTQVYARIEHDIQRVTGYIERVNDAIAQ